MSETGTDLRSYQECATPAEKDHVRKMLDRRARRAGPGAIELVDQGKGRNAIQLAGKTNSLAQLKALASSGLHNSAALFMLVKQLAHLDADAIDLGNHDPSNEALACPSSYKMGHQIGLSIGVSGSFV